MSSNNSNMYRGPPGPRGLSVVIEPNVSGCLYSSGGCRQQQNVCPKPCPPPCPPQPCPVPQPCQTIINNITNNITQTADPVLTVHCPQFITLPGLPNDISGNTVSGYIGVWGTGTQNSNFYIGSGYGAYNDASGNAYTSYTAPLNYINYLPFDVVDPVQSDIEAFDISGQLVPSRGYMVTDFWNPPVQPVYYFYGQWAMYRTSDVNAINASGGGPWRYYLQLQPTTSLDLQEVEQPQLFTYLPLPDITASGEVDSYVEGTMPLDTAFNYVPHRGFRLALWGQQGPNPWSRRSHSAVFNSTPQELLNLTTAEMNLTLAQNQLTLDTAAGANASVIAIDITNVNNAQTALTSAENQLPKVFPNIRVWPNFYNSVSGQVAIPKSLDAWIGIQPPTIKTVYYICKFSVNAVAAGTDQLMITSTSTTTPVGAPIAYPHYQNPIATYVWSGSYGISPVVLSSPQPNPYPIEGSGTTPTNGATGGYLTFIPIQSNSVYSNGVMTSELIDPNIPIPDSGFVMTFELEKEIGLKLNNNSAHKIFVRRLNPTPTEFTADLIDSGAFMLEPILLTDAIYSQLPSITFDDIDGTKGPVWDTNNTSVIYTTGGKTVEPYGFYGNGMVANPAIPSGMFTYSLTPRDFNAPDTDTAIIAINFITYQ